MEYWCYRTVHFQFATHTVNTFAVFFDIVVCFQECRNFGNNELRIFFIYDGDTIVVLFNGFKKKTQKTPKSEIDKAVKLKNEYYAIKGNQ